MKMPKLIHLTAKDDWNRVLAHAQCIHGTRERPKVLMTRDRYMIKWFYPRGGLSSDRLFPYAKRFIKHSRQLEQKGFTSVDVQAWYYDPQTQAYVVIYPMIVGMTVREAMQTESAEKVMNGFVDFVVECHARGVFFRGIHLGNVLVRSMAASMVAERHISPKDNLSFALIDVTDCKVQQHALNRWQRVRNIKHLFANLDDRQYYAAYGVQRFIDRYVELTGVEVEMKMQAQSARSNPTLASVTD